MEDVARAAGLSRQGLYLRFPNKAALFRASYERTLDRALGAATTALADEASPLERRLVAAFVAWVGPSIGVPTAITAELSALANELLGAAPAEREARFLSAVAAVLRASGLSWRYKPAGLGARQLAATLYATARGLRDSATLSAFDEGMALAARALCLPLRDADGD